MVRTAALATHFGGGGEADSVDDNLMRRLVYRGYVDDPRNTDNAWLETTAVLFHCSAELGERMHLAAGDDAAKAEWLDVSDSDERERHEGQRSHFAPGK